MRLPRRQRGLVPRPAPKIVESVCLFATQKCPSRDRDVELQRIDAAAEDRPRVLAAREHARRLSSSGEYIAGTSAPRCR